MRDSGQDGLPERDDRSAIAKAADVASRIITISLATIVPGVAGYWIDQKLATRWIFTLVGFGIGMTFGAWQLTLLTRVGRGVSTKRDGGTNGGH